MEQLFLKENELAGQILLIRGQRIILDFHLALLYNVQTRALKQQVRRNITRFPPDFMFELTDNEANCLVSQNVIPGKKSLGGAKPMAFTEQGVAMLSGILTSRRAIEVNIALIRTFVYLRRLLETNFELAQKISDLENKYDSQFQIVFEAIRQLIKVESEPIRPIGFRIAREDKV